MPMWGRPPRPSSQAQRGSGTSLPAGGQAFRADIKDANLMWASAPEVLSLITS